MKITLSSSSSKKKQKSPLQKRFDKLVKQVEQETKRFERLQVELDDLVHRFHQEIRETDRRHLPELIELAERLTVFASRKSLSEWHRHELMEWFAGLTQRIGALEATERDRLHQAFESSLAKLAGMELDEYRQLMEESMRRMEQEFYEDEEQDEAEFEDWEEEFMQDDLFGYDPELDGEDAKSGAGKGADDGPNPFGESDEDFEDPFKDWFGAANPPSPKSDLKDEAWVRKLFRKAAQQLHPDKETDPKARAEKEKRMTELLAARKEGDVLTLLRIWGETGGESSFALAEEQMEALCQDLEVRLHNIEMEKTHYLHSHPDRPAVYDMLYSSSKQRREQNFKNWRRDLIREVGMEVSDAKRVTNLDRLKEKLRSRRWEREDFEDEMLSALFDEFR